MLSVENKRSVTIAAGLSGTGKSTFGLRWLVNDDFAVCFCFDPDGEFSQRLGIPAAEDPYALGVQLCQGFVIFDPHAMFPGRLSAGFGFFCDWAFAMSARIPGRKLLVVDEVWKYCTPKTIPEELAVVVQTGRKVGLALLVNTQRPNLLNGAILNEVSEMVCFRLQEGNALEKVSEYGFDPEELRALPDLHLIGRNLDTGGELRGRIEI